MKSLISFTVFLNIAIISLAQPNVDAYLSNIKSYSKGGTIESTEDTFELLIKDIPPKPFKVITKYDNEGYLTSETRFNNFNAKQSETIWTYNTNKKLTKKTQTYFVNMVGWKVDEVTLKYNDTTGYLSEIQYVKNKVVQSISKVFCDNYGIPYEARVLDEKGAYKGIERISYSPNANIIRVMVLEPSGKFSGLYIYPIDYSKPYQSGSIERQYNSNGDITLESLDYQTKTDQGYFYEYNYDGRGNWIEKETYQVTFGKNKKVKDKKLEHKIVRKIKYY